MFVCSIVRFIGAYYAELGGLDQLIFTGGIGENARPCQKQSVRADPASGRGAGRGEKQRLPEGTISSAASAVAGIRDPANEELGVARQTYGYIEKMEG